MKAQGWSIKTFAASVIIVLLGLAGNGFADVLHVKAGLATGNHDGSSWANAFRYLQDALVVAQAGDEVWVAQGTYYPDESTRIPNGTGDRNATFSVPAGTALYGGFAGGELLLSQRTGLFSTTIMSGDLLGDDVPNTFNGQSENAFHVVTTPLSGCLVDGFRITGGNSGGAPSPVPEGAGVRALGAVNLRNCAVKWNTGDFGVWCNAGDYQTVNIDRCEISRSGVPPELSASVAVQCETH